MNVNPLIRYAVILVILISNSGTVFSQSVIQNEDDLVSTIAAVKLHGKSVAALLEEHKDLVTDKLWDKLIETAITSSNNREFSRALFLLDAAKEVAEQLEDQKLVASVWYYIGKLHSDNGDYKTAIAAYLKSKQAYEAARANAEIVYILGELGTLYLFAADYEKAKEYSVQSLSLAGTLRETEWASVRLTHRGKAAALSNLANISKQDGEYDRALDYIQQSLAVFKQLDADNSNQSFDHISPKHIDEGSASFKVEIAFALADIGRIYRIKGDHIQALLYFHQALTLAQSRNMKFVLAGVLNSMGMLYMEQGDYTKAIDLFDQSLKASVLDNDSLGIARVPINIGVIHQRQGDYEEAIKNFQLALSRAEAIGATEIIIAAQQGLGAVCQERGEYIAALKWLDRALLTAQRVGDKPRIAEVLWLSAEVHYLKGELPEATELATRAADLADQLRLPVITYLSLTAKGKAYLAQRNNEMAFQTLSQAITKAEALRFQIAGGEQERELSFENRIAPYNLMVELLISQNKLADAFLYAERAKGRVLLDVLSSGKLNITKEMTAREREQEQNLNRALVEINNQLQNESIKSAPDNGILGNLNARLNSARVEYETFENVLYATHPELRVRRGQTPLPDLNSISDYVQKKDTAFLDYVVTGDKVFLFVLTKQEQSDKLNLTVYPINTQGGGLIQKANKLRQMIANRSPVFADLARELYDVLIKPAGQQLHGKKTLCIIPDGYLWDVPFQALQPNDNRYLLEDHAIYYAQSLSVLRNMAGQGSRGTNNMEPSLIAFGNPTFGGETVARLQEARRGESFDALPEAEREVATIEQMFGRERSRVFTGADASEKQFKQSVSAYNNIHMATHGVLDNAHPLYSYLLLAKAGGDTDNDGLLEAREIMSMNIHADLAVLSACETARGRVGAGEGVIGMSWAFFVAGVRTTVVSQWKMNSTSTSQLMVNFYQTLKLDKRVNAEKKAEALRTAELSLMKDSRYRHPFYWAGFVMVGSNE